MTDQTLLSILKWLGAADALLLLLVGGLFLVWLSIEYVCSITRISTAVVQWRVDKWRNSRRIVTSKEQL